ncbi:MAG: hypothetical protein AAF585_13880 [Verrucomicrobiota bacterium]
MPTSPNERLQFAAIGCDRMAWKDISTIGGHASVEMMGLCDIDATRFIRAEERWPGRPRFSDDREMFDALDGKDRCGQYHALTAQEASKRRFHVYWQKVADIIHNKARLRISCLGDGMF